MKKSLKDYVQQREMERTGGTPERASFHSKGYHQYFDGYSEYRETDEKGKTRIRRVYTGIYHTAKVSDAARRGIHASYIVLWLLSAGLYFFLSTREVESNVVWYTAVAEALAIFGLVWVLWSLGNYLAAGKNMTQDGFRYTSALCRASACACAAQLLTAAATIAHAVLGTDQMGKELLIAAGFAICAVCALGIRLIEQRIPYDSFLSDAKVPDDANQITSEE